MTQSHLGISTGSLRTSDGCGKLHDAARTYAPGHLLRQYLSSRRLKPTSAPLNLSPIGNGTSKFLLLSKVFVHSRSLITYGLITSQRPASSLSCTSFQTMFSGSLLSFLRVERGVCAPESSSKAIPSDRCPTRGLLSAAKSSSSIGLGSSSPKRYCDGKCQRNFTPHIIERYPRENSPSNRTRHRRTAAIDNVSKPYSSQTLHGYKGNRLHHRRYSRAKRESSND